MYTIHQMNNTFDVGAETLQIVDKMYIANHVAFGGPTPLSDYLAFNQLLYKEQYQTQWFYIMSDSGDVVSSLRILARDGVHPNSVSLNVSTAFTNPKYRGQGHFGVLLHWVTQHYENGTINCPEGYHVDESIQNGTSQKYIDTIIPADMRANSRVHWTLHSIVGNYYARFGFMARLDMNWLSSDAAKVNGRGDFKDFQPENDNETFLTQNDLKKYFFDSKYTFETPESEKYQNLAQHESQIAIILKGLDGYVNDQDNLTDKDIFQNCGFKITDGEQETLVFVTPFFLSSEIVVQRVFTSVTDKEVLTKHWNRISDFIFSYSQRYWDTMTWLEPVPLSDRKIVMADTDFICASDVISRSEWINMVVSSNSWVNEGPKLMIPMIKSWKNEQEDIQLAYNGYIGIM